MTLHWLCISAFFDSALELLDLGYPLFDTSSPPVLQPTQLVQVRALGAYLNGPDPRTAEIRPGARFGARPEAQDLTRH